MSMATGIEQSIEATGSQELAGNALALISQELMETIRNAHLALEDCVDGRTGSPRSSTSIP